MYMYIHQNHSIQEKLLASIHVSIGVIKEIFHGTSKAFEQVEGCLMNACFFTDVEEGMKILQSKWLCGFD